MENQANENLHEVIDAHIKLILGTENNNFYVPQKEIRLLHAIMGIVTEAAELMDIMKKHYVYNRTLDIDKLIDELGDLLYYTFQAVDDVFVEGDFKKKLTKVITKNLAKLLVRYPGGEYSQDRANNRDTDAEKAAQERIGYTIRKMLPGGGCPYCNCINPIEMGVYEYTCIACGKVFKVK